MNPQDFPAAELGTDRATLVAVLPPSVSRRVFAAVLAGLVVGACLSPTLPLPPPSRPEVAGPDASGNLRLTGRVPGEARVSALNARTNFISGQQTERDGAYDFTIAAAPGDEITFWYTKNNTNSPGLVLYVEAPEDGEAGLGGAAPDGQ